MRISKTKMRIHVLHPTVCSWVGIAPLLPGPPVFTQPASASRSDSLPGRDAEDRVCGTPARESSEQGYRSDRERDDADRPWPSHPRGIPKGKRHEDPENAIPRAFIGECHGWPLVFLLQSRAVNWHTRCAARKWPPTVPRAMTPPAPSENLADRDEFSRREDRARLSLCVDSAEIWYLPCLAGWGCSSRPGLSPRAQEVTVATTMLTASLPERGT